MKYAGKQFTGDFVHIGDHQEQSLRCSEGGGKGSTLQGTVNGTCCACLTLHFGNLYSLAENVFPAIGRPLVNKLSHVG